MATVPTAPAGVVTYLRPQDEATEALQSASAETLLDAIVQLTHRIHTADGDTANDLRAQRTQLRLEVLRRLRGAR